ncbi:histone H1 [Oreochromis niloticus]|uniref:histone H1 n=1 Tax=Oreochromis niloticus TaxID=8128 RepID=UPI00022AF8ED|nr:histone H1 [Oreochromis niloticus]
MRRKATATNPTQLSALGNSASEKSGEKTHLKVIKQIERPSKTPAGKGLGKAGAKRLGRLLKRAIPNQDEATGKANASLPKTPVRLFKHQIQTEAGNAPKTNSAKPTSPHISQLILSVVSQCKHRGGISMAELKQMLAAGGYDVAKNNRRVNIETKRLVNNETLVRTTRNASFRLNHKKLTDTIQVRTIPVKTPKPKAELKLTPKTATSKSPKGAENQKRRVLKPNQTKPKSKSHQTRATPRKVRSPNRKRKRRRMAVTSHKLARKTRKAAAKSHKQRRKTTKGRKSPKPAGKKRRPATNRGARVRKAPRKAQKTRRRRPNRVQNRHKKQARRRLPKSKLRSRKSTYYYH